MPSARSLTSPRPRAARLVSFLLRVVAEIKLSNGTAFQPTEGGARLEPEPVIPPGRNNLLHGRGQHLRLPSRNCARYPGRHRRRRRRDGHARRLTRRQAASNSLGLCHPQLLTIAEQLTTTLGEQLEQRLAERLGAVQTCNGGGSGGGSRDARAQSTPSIRC